MSISTLSGLDPKSSSSPIRITLNPSTLLFPADDEETDYEFNSEQR
jgi:hypothetical protein